MIAHLIAPSYRRPTAKLRRRGQRSWRKQLGHCACAGWRKSTRSRADEGGAASLIHFYFYYEGVKIVSIFEEASLGGENIDEFFHSCNREPRHKLRCYFVHLQGITIKQKQIDRTPSYSFKRLRGEWPSKDIVDINPDSSFIVLTAKRIEFHVIR